MNPSTLRRILHWYKRSCQASRAHTALACRLSKQYGEHGPLISGVVRDHFPDKEKDRLSKLARRTARYSNKAMALRPKGTHKTTMLDIGRSVTARYGKGFYGFLVSHTGEHWPKVANLLRKAGLKA